MNITFQESELVNYVGKVEKWHEDKFKFVVLKMFENFDPYQFCMRGEPMVAARVREFVERYEKDFLDKNPRPDWKDML